MEIKSKHNHYASGGCDRLEIDGLMGGSWKAMFACF
jgi:hypothetical protein